jgi:hypothetical protein
MKIRSLARLSVLTLLLSTVAFGGDMPGPGSPERPPKPASAESMPAICEPIGSRASEVAVGTACNKPTTDFATDAIIIAIQLLVSAY